MSAKHTIGEHKEDLVGKTIRLDVAPVSDPAPDMEVLEYVTAPENATEPVLRVRYPNGFETELPAHDHWTFEFVDDVEPGAES